MSHYFESGFSVRVPMWHGLGVVLDDYPATPEEACALAKSDWLVEKSPLMVQRPFSDAERRARAIELASLATDNFKKGGFMQAATLDTDALADALFARLTPAIANVDVVPNAWAITRSDTGAPLGGSGS